VYNGGISFSLQTNNILSINTLVTVINIEKHLICMSYYL